MYIWCQWICGRCGEVHRVRFQVEVTEKLGFVKGAWRDRDILIQDMAYHKIKRPRRRGTAQYGSKIFCEPLTPILQIEDALRQFMEEFYSIKEDTLTMEVCMA